MINDSISFVCSEIPSNASTNYNISGNSHKSFSERERIISDLMKIFLKNRLTLTGLEDTAKLLNSMPGANVRLPITKYSILKEFYENSDFELKQLFLCSECDIRTSIAFKEQEKMCSSCNSDVSRSNFFIYFGFQIQIKSIVQNNFESIFKYRDEITREKNDIKDCYNSEYMISRLRTNENMWTLTVNTDGVSVHNSNTFSLWPILLTCNFLPPNIRYKKRNVITLAIFYDNHKPNMLQLFEPFAEEFQNLQTTGMIINGLNFRFFVTAASMDLPAKCSVQQMIQYNGYNACGYCFHSGKKTVKGVKYDYNENGNIMRSHEDFIKAMANVNQNPQLIDKGVKGVSPMIAFDCFDLSKSFTIDYMHATLIGLMGTMLGFWLDSKWKKKPFYLTKLKRSILNKRLVSIKPCRFISRRPRSLDEIKHFKASEFRSLLIYYLPVCLDGILPKRFIDHFKNLSSSIYSLLQQSISRENIFEARTKLRKYVSDYQNIYGIENMNMNVHLMEHLCDCVENFGPLWSYSLFAFESYNGILKNYVVSNNDVLHQIATRYVIEHSLRKENICHPAHVLVQLKKIVLTNTEKIALQNENIQVNDQNETTIFTAFQRGVEIITSKYYTKSKYTMDYFMNTVHGRLGKISFFFKSNDKDFALFDEYSVIKTIDQIRVVQAKNELSVIAVSELKEKFIYMCIDRKEFVVKRPNTFEKD